ncbi:hypothetical protein POM88_005238 [Heracleum sosnowskyi]|uniref:Uncharacterized protein n=1 Tax=Heracleum sosnowskyi TaxID=360622 RepID=A0AAD8NF42_9APIA|nr:hypothetical protein POM88_005238 [Heracleum sosnowskyi]
MPLPSPLICGSFQNQQDEDFEFLGSFTSPRSRKPAKWHSFGGSKGNKNPYADRGLDKFSALVAELDSKRKKIYTQKGSEDISLIGFVYSNSNHYKPIVVKLKNKKQQSTASEKDKLKPDLNISPPASSEIEPAKPDQVKVLSRIGTFIKTTPKKVRFDMVKNIQMENPRRPWLVLCSDNPKLGRQEEDQGQEENKRKTMKKAMSYNNKNVKISSATLDHGYKSPSLPASSQLDRRMSFPT